MIAVALLAGFLIWLLVPNDDESAPGTDAATLEPTATSRAELVTLAREVGHPIFWVGPKEGAQLEVRGSPEGEVLLRYLTGNAEIGDSRQAHLTIGTYPFPSPIDALERLATREGALTAETPNGAFVLTNESEPTSVYLAYPDQPFQIEVYDPDPERAFRLATSDEVVPVE